MDAAVYIYNTAKCKLPNEEECNPGERCCKHLSSLNFSEEIGNSHIVVTMQCEWETVVNIPCNPPANCTPICFEVSNGVNPDNCNNELCADGYWYEETVEVDIWGCNDCVVTMTYQWRTNANCEPPSYEYKIMSWTQSPECDYCYGGANQIYDGMVGWLLENGPITDGLENGQCEDRVKITNPQCWDIRDWPQPDTWAECPNNTACCWRTYRICRDELGNLLSPVLLDFNGYTQQCEEPCTAICGNFPTIYLPDETTSANNLSDIHHKNSYIVPNPNKGSVTLHINSNLMGYVKLEIYSIIGEYLHTEEILKNSDEFTRTIDVGKFPANHYYINISIDGKWFDTLKMIIKK